MGTPGKEGIVSAPGSDPFTREEHQLGELQLCVPVVAIIRPELWILHEAAEPDWLCKLALEDGPACVVMWQNALLTGEQLSEDKKRAQTS